MIVLFLFSTQDKISSYSLRAIVVQNLPPFFNTMIFFPLGTLHSIPWSNPFDKFQDFLFEAVWVCELWAWVHLLACSHRVIAIYYNSLRVSVACLKIMSEEAHNMRYFSFVMRSQAGVITCQMWGSFYQSWAGIMLGWCAPLKPKTNKRRTGNWSHDKYSTFHAKRKNLSPLSNINQPIKN